MGRLLRRQPGNECTERGGGCGCGSRSGGGSGDGGGGNGGGGTGSGGDGSGSGSGGSGDGDDDGGRNVATCTHTKQGRDKSLDASGSSHRRRHCTGEKAWPRCCRPPPSPTPYPSRPRSPPSKVGACASTHSTGSVDQLAGNPLPPCTRWRPSPSTARHKQTPPASPRTASHAASAHPKRRGERQLLTIASGAPRHKRTPHRRSAPPGRSPHPGAPPQRRAAPPRATSPREPAGSVVQTVARKGGKEERWQPAAPPSSEAPVARPGTGAPHTTAVRAPSPSRQQPATLRQPLATTHPPVQVRRYQPPQTAQRPSARRHPPVLRPP